MLQDAPYMNATTDRRQLGLSGLERINGGKDATRR
jgi:hypothetical protein